MNKLFLFVTFAFITNSLKAQTDDLALAKVHYLFKHVNDTTQRDKFLRDEVVTYIGPSASYYASYSSTRAQEQMSAMMNDPSFDGNLNISRNTSPIKEEYLLNPSKGEFQEIKKLAGDAYVFKLEAPEQDWSVSEEIREIGGYNCQKATTYFKGRHYTAWFTTELPFSYGPWKLHGLPGLILEAYDTDKDVVFEYNGFDKELGEKPFVVKVSDNAHAVSVQEFEKQQKAFDANPQAYIDARRGTNARRIPSGGGTGGATMYVSGGSAGSTITSTAPPKGAIDVSKIKSISINQDENYTPSKDTNNPIELAP